MTIDEFVLRVQDEFEEIPAGALTADGDFRKLFEWNSMNALVLMALISTELDSDITADELRGCTTIRQIYTIVINKKVA